MCCVYYIMYVYVIFCIHTYVWFVWLVTKSAVFDARVLLQSCTAICCEIVLAFQMFDYGYVCKSFVCRLFLLIN
jgi:hypothetical protein